MREAFKIFDSQGSKFITFNSLKSVLVKMGQKMSDDDINNLIKEADSDADGRVSYQDFKKLMQR